MLAYLLALIVGSGSFALYMAAFFFPEIYRKNDLVWSGVGLFYALVLWVYAGRLTGGILLGQVASVALLGWLGWQTVMMRRQQAPTAQQTALPTTEQVQVALSSLTKPETLSQIPSQLSQQVSQLAGRIQAAIKQSARQSGQGVAPPQSKTTYTPPSPEEFGTAGQQINQRLQAVDTRIQAAVTEGKDKPENRFKQVQAAGTEVVEETIAEAPASTQTIADHVTEVVTEVKQAIDATAPSTPRIPQPAQVPQAAKTSPPGPLSGLFGQAQSTFKKLTQKESKPVYVRKQYRQAAAVSPETSSQPEAEEAASTKEPVITEVTVSEVTFVSAGESARLEQAVEELESIFEDEPETMQTSTQLQNSVDGESVDGEDTEPDSDLKQ
ncbi:MAG: Ycf66 family protein [Leptolyngbyaceae cyanobacterium]